MNLWLHFLPFTPLLVLVTDFSPESSELFSLILKRDRSELIA